MGVLLIVLVVLPLAAAGVSAVGHRVARVVTVVAGLVSLGLTVALVPAVTASGAAGGAAAGVALGFLRADALSLVFLLATTFLYVVAATYSVGYLAAERKHPGFARYSRRFHVGLNLFAWSMICAPLVDGLALLWVAVEVTTVVSALLVALDNTRQAAEAAWKYVLLASVGLGIALLGTIVMYYAGSQVLGQSYDLAFPPLLAVGDRLPPDVVRLAFVLAVVGFGTKVGLFPVHTWLPDAHSEAPTPVSAMLSGALLVVSFYAVLRYFQIAQISLGAGFPRGVLLVFGMLSLLLAAVYVLQQRDLKRLLAYSSVEHMGILAIGVSFGSPIAAAGVLLHVVAHAAAKANAFFGAGVIVRAFGSKDLDRVRGVLDRLPWTGPLFLAAILALSALPPFGLFRSEFQIVAGGVATGTYAPAAAMVALVTLAFVGLSLATTRVLFIPADTTDTTGTAAASTVATTDGRATGMVGSAAACDGGFGAAGFGTGPGAARAPRAASRREPSGWMVAPMVVGFVVLVVLGVHPPAELAELFAQGAAQIVGAR